MAVEVSPASEAEKPLIEGLFHLYTYDFSEMEPPGSIRFEVDAFGRFAPYAHLDTYWSVADRWPLIIRSGGRVAGFALINTHAHSGGSLDRSMAEFFVLRKHRRGGVAAEAVRQILSLHPGRWEVAVSRLNLAAQAFWPRAIAAVPNVERLERLEGDGERWRGPIWTFVVRP